MYFRAAIVISFFLVFVFPCWSAEYDAFPDLNRDDPASLQEATRVVEAELKLAARPQAYLLLDLAAGVIRIKGRGVDLHRMAIETWSFSAPTRLTGTFRLISRPTVVRRKIDPTSTAEQEPISLADMPTDFSLSFIPPLRVDIQSVRGEGLVRRTISSAAKAWQRLKAWGISLTSNQDQASQAEPNVTITLSVEQAQSLAWSTVDGMALIIRRPTGQ